MQPQGHLQVITNLIDFNLNPQESLDAPRWQWIEENLIEVEEDMPLDIVKGLMEKGHKIKIVKDFTSMGKGQIILKKKLNEKESIYISATEKRCDGHIAIW